MEMFDWIVTGGSQSGLACTNFLRQCGMLKSGFTKYLNRHAHFLISTASYL